MWDQMRKEEFRKKVCRFLRRSEHGWSEMERVSMAAESLKFQNRSGEGTRRMRIRFMHMFMRRRSEHFPYMELHRIGWKRCIILQMEVR